MSHRYDELIVDAMAQLATGAREGTPLGTILSELTQAAVGLIDGVWW